MDDELKKLILKGIAYCLIYGIASGLAIRVSRW